MDQHSLHAASYDEIQNNEVLALSAIFQENFDNLDRNENNEIMFNLHLLPHLGMTFDNYSQLCLNVILPAKYPSVVPRISLTRERGLTDTELAQIRELVESFLSKNEGSEREYIYELCIMVVDWLAMHNEPPHKSLLDDLHRKKCSELDTILDESRPSEDSTTESANYEKDSMGAYDSNYTYCDDSRQRDGDLNIDDYMFNTSTVISGQNFQSTNVEKMPNFSKILNFNVAAGDTKLDAKGRDLSHFNDRWDNKCSEDSFLSLVKDSGVENELGTPYNYCNADGYMVGSEISLFPPNSCNNRQMRSFAQAKACLVSNQWTNPHKLFSSLQKETLKVVLKFNNSTVIIKKYNIPSHVEDAAIDRIMGLLNRSIELKHSALVPYIAVEYYSEARQILVARKFMPGAVTVLTMQQRAEDTICQRYLVPLMDALQYLHGLELFGANLKLNNLLIDSDGTVKLSDYVGNSLLDGLIFSPGTKKASHLVGDEEARKLSDRMSDINNLAYCYLELLMGRRQNEIPSFLSVDCRSFLSMCLQAESPIEFKVLRDHPFLNHKIDQSISFLPLSGPTYSSSSNVPRRGSSGVTIDGHSSFKSYSRYREDFEESSTIGKGGFGIVAVARNKLDNQLYAIKKVFFGEQTNNAFMDHLRREVITFSRLNHENVVRYYHSWIEDANPDDLVQFHESSKDEEDSLFYSNSSNQEFTQKKVLYIQMEYCKARTLRNLIDDGRIHSKNDEDKRWRIFRQIVAALNHIHSQGIIHRDLKPENIFLDSNENVKVGDFGLAITPEDEDVNETNQAKMDILENKFTIGVGTPLYLAPEQDGSKYDEKVDIYSLGIILFEIFQPFNTKYERIETLRKLRTKDVILPPEWSPNFVQTKLVRWMLSFDPIKRPTTTEILQNDLLPHEFEEEMMKKALLHITKPTSNFYNLLLKTLLNNEPDRSTLLAYDAPVNKSFSATPSKRYMVHEKLRNIFESFAAVELNPPMFIPRIAGLMRPQTVSFVDSTGTPISLPYDLTVPFARYLLFNKELVEKNCFIRRYVLSKVYRLTAGQPKELEECDFDLVGPKQYRVSLTCQAIQILIRVLNEFKEELGSFLLYFSNLELVNEIYMLASPDLQMHRELRNVLGTYFKSSKYSKKLEDKLLDIEGLDVEKLEIMKLKELLNLRCSNKSAFEMLEQLDLLYAKHPTIRLRIAQTRELLNFAKRYEIDSHLRFDPTISYKSEYYSDFIFQVVLPKSGVIAFGGCYDSLLDLLSDPQVHGKKSFSVCGVTISLVRLIKLIDSHWKNKQLKSFIDIYIYSQIPPKIDEPLSACLQTAMIRRNKIAEQLRQRGLVCEYFYDESWSEAKLESHCRQQNIPYMITIKEDKKVDFNQFLKLKDIFSKQEQVISLSAMLEYFESLYGKNGGSTANQSPVKPKNTK